MPDKVLVDVDDGVMVITINRADVPTPSTARCRSESALRSTSSMPVLTCGLPS